MTAVALARRSYRCPPLAVALAPLVLPNPPVACSPPRHLLLQLIAKVLPSREAINEVERIAKSFWAEHPSLFIAIHW